MHQLRPGMSVEVNIDTAAQPAGEGAP